MNKFNLKGIILDIDNTIYDYQNAHLVALSTMTEKMVLRLDIDAKIISEAYQKARKQIHIELYDTASSHNRLLYTQRMLELLKVDSMQYCLEFYNSYWDEYLENMNIFSGLIDYLEKIKNKKICLLTDLTAHIQHRKIQKLGLYKYTNFIVTSEEAGHDKPHPYMFLLALKKFNLKANEVIMIGDNFQKDILGASNLGIKSYWFNVNRETKEYDKNLISEFKNFDSLGNF